MNTLLTGVQKTRNRSLIEASHKFAKVSYLFILHCKWSHHL